MWTAPFSRLTRPIAWAPALAFALSAAALVATVNAQGDDAAEATKEQQVIRCANLIYSKDKTSICFSDAFLMQAERDTNLVTSKKFTPMRLDSDEVYKFPFSVMTGEGSFALTPEQRANLRSYLTAGGFMIASAGCSSMSWGDSFRKEIKQVFPDSPLVKLDEEHPIFTSVYDVRSSRYRTGGARLPHLEALEIDGRVVMVFSPDGLNDAASLGGKCCCCGGNEVKSARKLNVNILAYAITH